MNPRSLDTPMTSWRRLWVSSALAVAFWAMIFSSWKLVADEPTTATSEKARVPVLVELFTSQGCSSCPPADRLLTTLAESQLEGIELIPLSYHVDYWNRLGWRDPFSSAEWSERQTAYARALQTGRLYTPQMVVNGSDHEVGSNASRVGALIERAAALPPAAELQVVARRESPNSLTVRVEGELLRAIAGRTKLQVALWETGHRTAVPRGENARRELANDYVVRLLEGRSSGAQQTGEQVSAEITFKVNPSWRTEHLGIAAFLQHSDTLVVEAAAVSRIDDRG